MSEGNDSVPGLYIHIPFCDGKCSYCAFYSILYEEQYADRYLAAVEREIALANLRPETIYVGGGTPTSLSAQQLRRLCSIVLKTARMDRLLEWTFEGNPGSLSAEKLEVMASAGVNRISLGAQSFDSASLNLLGRRHNAADVAESVRLVRESGIRNLNLDLIACIPGLSRQKWESTILQAVDLGVEHMSIYALTAEEGTRLKNCHENGEIKMLSDDEQLEALDAAERILTNAGFFRYEISNYARPQFECRHNVSCWRGGEYAGIGPSAASHEGFVRRINTADVQAYIEALELGKKPPLEQELLTPELKIMEKLVFGLRLAEGIDAGLGADRGEQLRELARDGLVFFKNGRWMLTPKGRNLADYVGSELAC